MLEKSKYKSATQEFLEIYDITNDLILLKNGTASLILGVSAMNFGLLAEDEQDAVIYTYAALLNSLNYPIQIIIQSQTKDVTKYLNLLKEKENETFHSPQGERIARYREFVANLIKERNVLDKKFFVIIPATPLELELLSAESVIPGRDVFDITKYEKTVLVDKAQAILEPRRDHLISQFARIGLVSWQLTTQEIIRVFYTNYNPEASEGFEGTNTEEYQTAVVKASIIDDYNPLNQALPTDQPIPQSLNDQFDQPEQPSMTVDQPQPTQTQQFDQFGKPVSTQYFDQSVYENPTQLDHTDQAGQLSQQSLPDHNQLHQLDQELNQQFEQQANQLDQAFDTSSANNTVGVAPSFPTTNQEQSIYDQPSRTTPEQAQEQFQQLITPVDTADHTQDFQEGVPDFSNLKANFSNNTSANQSQPKPNQEQDAAPRKSQTHPNPQQAVNNTLREVGVFNLPEPDKKTDTQTVETPAKDNSQTTTGEPQLSVQPNELTDSSQVGQPNEVANTQGDNPPPIPEIM